MRVVEADVLLGEKEVVGRDLAGDAESIAASLTNGRQSTGGGGVGYMKMSAGLAQFGDEADVALN
jgi:hypothetical protein